MRIALRVISIAGAVIVVGSLFLHWWTEIVLTGTSPNTVAESGWHSFHHGDAALAAMAGAAIVVAVFSFFVPRRALMAATGVLGVAAVALTVRHIASPPESAVSTDIGAYLGLAGAAILATAGIGAALLMPEG
ncbi:MAG: hypothetical protein E6G49_11955 [Actinobacteria bacterium]|jgi:hypothetical protein|nr:MAG: hypothetical protein E6G49_11955 [Actinomycetota bacterium]